MANMLTAGIFTVTVTDSQGCELVETITVDIFTDTKGIQVAGMNIQIQIFPNPISNGSVSLVIEGAMGMPINVKITTMLGQVMEKSEVLPNSNKTVFWFRF